MLRIWIYFMVKCLTHMSQLRLHWSIEEKEQKLSIHRHNVAKLRRNWRGNFRCASKKLQSIGEHFVYVDVITSDYDVRHYFITPTQILAKNPVITHLAITFFFHMYNIQLKVHSTASHRG